MKLQYVGNCVESFDSDCNSIDLRETVGMIDASDFACVEENSTQMDKDWFVEKLINANDILFYGDIKDCTFLWNEDRQIAIIYNHNRDIHYFFAPTN